MGIEDNSVTAYVSGFETEADIEAWRLANVWDKDIEIRYSIVLILSCVDRHVSRSFALLALRPGRVRMSSLLSKGTSQNELHISLCSWDFSSCQRVVGTSHGKVFFLLPYSSSCLDSTFVECEHAAVPSIPKSKPLVIVNCSLCFRNVQWQWCKVSTKATNPVKARTCQDFYDRD